MKTVRGSFLAVLATLAIAGSALPAAAVSLTYELWHEFSGSQTPENLLSVTIADAGADTVTITMSVTGSSLTEFVDDWMLNYSGTATDLHFTLTSDTLTGSDPVVSLGSNAFRVGGQEYYDIMISFDQAPPRDRFGAGDTVTYTVSGVSGLDASDFNVDSAINGGLGPHRTTAAHVQGIGADGEGSGWVSTPEPGAVGVFSIGLLVAGVLITCFRKD